MRAVARAATIGAVPPPPPKPPRRRTAESHTPTVDRYVGPYELVGKIATGGMGAVYLCRHSGYGGFRRLMALKVMHPHLVRQTQFLAMFVDEARIAGRLHHPNAVAILDLQRSTRGPYVVMEYVEGCTLGQLLARNRAQRSPRMLVPLLIDVLAGLHAAHRVEGDDGELLGLVHRDVSPSNILVGVDGVARVTDFGIAKARARLTDTPTGTCKGKFSYAAPEQVTGGECDARTDVFAAGVVLWNALTGRPLFRGATDAATINNVLQRAIPAPSTVGLRPPECLDEVCMRALQRDPAARFQSAAEMADALRAVGSRHGLLGTPGEVGRWIDTCFGTELEARRRVIRASLSADSVALPLPLLPEIEEPDTELDAIVDLDGTTHAAVPSSRRRTALLTALLAACLLLAWSRWGDPARVDLGSAPLAGAANTAQPALAPIDEDAIVFEEPEVVAAEPEPVLAEPAPPPRAAPVQRARPRRLRRRPAPVAVAAPAAVAPVVARESAPSPAVAPPVDTSVTARALPALTAPRRDGGAHAESLDTPRASTSQRARPLEERARLAPELEPNPYE